MEHLLKKLNETMERAIEKIDDQGQRLTGIEVKVDMYREAQTEVARKLEGVDRTAHDALQSTKAAHKRLDSRDSDITWLKRAVIGGFITATFAFVGGLILAIIRLKL